MAQGYPESPIQHRFFYLRSRYSRRFYLCSSVSICGAVDLVPAQFQPSTKKPGKPAAVAAKGRKLQSKSKPMPLLLPPRFHTRQKVAQSPSNASRSAPDAPTRPAPIFVRSYGTPQTPAPATPPPSNPQRARRSYPISSAATPPPQSLPQTPPPTPRSSAPST